MRLLVMTGSFSCLRVPRFEVRPPLEAGAGDERDRRPSPVMGTVDAKDR